MYDQRIVGSEHLPKPAQWHRIAVHNEQLGAYAVQQLVKKYVLIPLGYLTWQSQCLWEHFASSVMPVLCSSYFSCYFVFNTYMLVPFISSPVFVEGDIETRVYNDSISGEIKNVPEICVRRDGNLFIHPSFNLYFFICLLIPCHYLCFTISFFLPLNGWHC